MGNHKPEEKKTDQKQPDLTGYESAQRKRFLQNEQEESKGSEDS